MRLPFIRQKTTFRNGTEGERIFIDPSASLDQVKAIAQKVWGADPSKIDDVLERVESFALHSRQEAFTRAELDAIQERHWKRGRATWRYFFTRQLMEEAGVTETAAQRLIDRKVGQIEDRNTGRGRMNIRLVLLGKVIEL